MANIKLLFYGYFMPPNNVKSNKNSVLLQREKATIQARYDKSDEWPLSKHLDLLSGNDNFACDESTDPSSHPDNCDLPPWYDEEKFIRGQEFYKYNIFVMFVGKLAGLVGVLGIPSILKILIFTKQSSTIETSYRRYVGTILHMHKWYSKDFRPGSESWKSLSEVRQRHNNASKRSAETNQLRVTHRDMALTQFGFVGFILAAPEKLGIQYLDKEKEIEGFVHFWRVIGWILGVEDKYNLCRHSTKETVKLCQQLIPKVFSPAVRTADEDFKFMYKILLQSMWYVNPMIYVNSFMSFVFHLTTPFKNGDKNDNLSTPKLELTDFEQRLDGIMVYLLRHLFVYNVIRIYFNLQLLFSLILIEYLPFLAFLAFGIRKSYVKLYQYVKS